MDVFEESGWRRARREASPANATNARRWAVLRSRRMDLRQHTILITGASSGIGRALAIAAHAAGARVIAAGRDQARLAAVARECPGLATVVGDLAIPEARSEFLVRLGACAPDLSIVIHNAGVQHPADHVAATDANDLARQAAAAGEEIAVNCLVPTDLTLDVLPRLKAAGEAAIVFITSGLALAPKAGSPVYCATKAFLRSFAKSLRYQCETGAPHIHVMEVLPPLVDTPMTSGRGRNKISAESVARATLAGLRRRSREVYVGKVRLLRWIHRVSPAAAERIMRGR